jgi:hypothetical protein
MLVEVALVSEISPPLTTFGGLTAVSWSYTTPQFPFVLSVFTVNGEV